MEVGGGCVQARANGRCLEEEGKNEWQWQREVRGGTEVLRYSRPVGAN